MRRNRKPEGCPLTEDEFHVLASYNAEVARGIVHTTNWKINMAVLQTKYNAWLLEEPVSPEAG